MSGSSLPDPWLVLRAQSGEREALEGLLRQLQAPLARHLRALAGPELADDLLQETLWTVCRKLGGLRDPRLVLAWACRIASRHAGRAMRRVRLEIPVEGRDPAVPSGQESHLEGEVWAARVPGLLASVPPASRVVLVLHYLQDLSLREVAVALALRPGTVRSRLAYGLRHLARSLGRPVR